MDLNGKNVIFFIFMLRLQFHDGNNEVIQDESILEADDVWILELAQECNLVKALHTILIPRMTGSLPRAELGCVVRVLG